MKSIKVTIQDRDYPLKVSEEEEQSIREIAEFVDKRFQQYREQLKKQPETTVMTMACLSIAEELFEERNKRKKYGQNEEQFLEFVNNSLEEILEELKG